MIDYETRAFHGITEIHTDTMEFKETCIMVNGRAVGDKEYQINGVTVTEKLYRNKYNEVMGYKEMFQNINYMY